MLGRRTIIDDAAIEQRGRKARSSITRIERSLREEIARLHEQLDESVATLGISPTAVERVVRTGLELGRQAGVAPAGKPREFIVPQLTCRAPKLNPNLNTLSVSQLRARSPQLQER
jgi:hypothetical protein